MENHIFIKDNKCPIYPSMKYGIIDMAMPGASQDKADVITSPCHYQLPTEKGMAFR
jgi:hypothetical protein